MQLNKRIKLHMCAFVISATCKLLWRSFREGDFTAWDKVPENSIVLGSASGIEAPTDHATSFFNILRFFRTAKSRQYKTIIAPEPVFSVIEPHMCEVVIEPHM